MGELKKWLLFILGSFTLLALWTGVAVTVGGVVGCIVGMVLLCFFEILLFLLIFEK